MKLSQRDQLGGVSQDNDTFHTVRGGQSFKRLFSDIMNTSRVPFRRVSGNREFLISRKDQTISPSQILQDGDILLYIDRDVKRMVLGMAIDEVSSYPNDLDDTLKFMKFIDNKAAF